MMTQIVRWGVIGTDTIAIPNSLPQRSGRKFPPISSAGHWQRGSERNKKTKNGSTDLTESQLSHLLIYGIWMQLDMLPLSHPLYGQ